MCLTRSCLEVEGLFVRTTFDGVVVSMERYDGRPRE